MVPGYLSVKCHQHYISLYEQDALQSQVCLLSLTLRVYASFSMCLIKLFYILHKNWMENTDCFRIRCNAAFLLEGLRGKKKRGGRKRKKARQVPEMFKFRMSGGKIYKSINEQGKNLQVNMNALAVLEVDLGRTSTLASPYLCYLSSRWRWGKVEAP